MKVTKEQLDSLRELINIGVGRGADVLNTILNSHIQLCVPLVKLLTREELNSELEIVGGERLASVNMRFKGNISGYAKLLFPSESALKLVLALSGEEEGPVDLDSIRAGTLAEIGNIVLNSVMGSISNILNLNLHYAVPNYLEGPANNLFLPNEINPTTVTMLAKTRFMVAELKVEGDIVIFFEVGSFDHFLASLNNMNHG